MPDATIIGISFLAIAVVAIGLRLVAIRSPRFRGLATLATFAIFALLLVLIGLFAWTFVSAYIGGLPD